MSLHTEFNFEIEICEQLTANGWLYSESSADYDRKLALFPADVLEWVQTTQPDEDDAAFIDYDDIALQTVASLYS